MIEEKKIVVKVAEPVPVIVPDPPLFSLCDPTEVMTAPDKPVTVVAVPVVEKK